MLAFWLHISFSHFFQRGSFRFRLSNGHRRAGGRGSGSCDVRVLGMQQRGGEDERCGEGRSDRGSDEQAVCAFITHEKISLGFKFFSCTPMKQNSVGVSCVRRKVPGCCNKPANAARLARARAAEPPNNLVNVARKRGVGCVCGEGYARDAMRKPGVGKKPSARFSRARLPLWCSFSGERHDNRA